MKEVRNKYNKKLLDRYLVLCKNKGLTEETIKAFKIDLMVFMRYLGDKNVDEITHIDVEDFLDYCVNERKNTPPTLDRKYTTLNSFYKTMLLKEYIDCKNPMDRVDKIKVRKKVREYLTEEEIKQFMDYLKSINDLRGLAILSLLYSSGIRLSELIQLNRDSLDFSTNRFVVLGKGMKERICIFSDEAKEYIINYLNLRTDNLEPLFLSRHKNRLAKKSVQHWIKKRAKEAGITKNVHPHLVRHSISMNLLMRGVPLDKIQVFLGHESIATTQIYAHNNIDDVQKSVEEVMKIPIKEVI